MEVEMEFQLKRLGAPRSYHQYAEVKTDERRRFIDLTDQVLDCVRESRVEHGQVNVQSLHTTAAVVINENEPLLLLDLEDALERWAPRGRHYRHDDFEIRTAHVQPGEPANGHSHTRALLLRTSETLNIVEGKLLLGRWQRIFLVELDGARTRKVSIAVTGVEELE